MKSLQVQEADYISPADKKNYSDLKVMRSAAGFYVGSTYRNELGFDEPGTRDSGYFPTEEAANEELQSLVGGRAPTRTHPAQGTSWEGAIPA